MGSYYDKLRAQRDAYNRQSPNPCAFPASFPPMIPGLLGSCNQILPSQEEFERCRNSGGTVVPFEIPFGPTAFFCCR